MKPLTFALYVTIIAVLIISACGCTTQSSTTVTTAPLSSAYIGYQQNTSAGKVTMHTPDGQPLGYVPPPKYIQKRATPAVIQALHSQIYPSTYDLRTLGKVNPVEQQYPCGTCWTFGVLGALESYLLPNSTTQFSENHLKDNSLFDETDCCPNSGGNALVAAAYLARWGTTGTLDNGTPINAGPVSLSCDPYNPGSCTSQNCSAVEHVQNIYFLPEKQSPTDNDAIKSALMTYGSIEIAINWEGDTFSNTPYWNMATSAYYENNVQTGNHSVSIVGWDDNYPATNFSTPPPGNGAYICKNSWGTRWGQQGFFYISYYDVCLNGPYSDLAVFTAEPTTNYKTNYQYDPFGWDDQLGGSTSAYGANVFNATSDGTLKAISFYATDPSTQYTANVYVNPAANDPASGTLSSTISGTVPYQGYYTEPLNTTVPLTTGETFSVVIKFTTPRNNRPVPIQERYQGVSDAAPTTPTGVSFFSTDGTKWIDVTTYGPADAVCIHAFADGQATPTPSPIPTVTPISTVTPIPTPLPI